MKITFFFGLFFFLFVLTAGEVPFRSGIVCAAEISGSDPGIENNKIPRIGGGVWAQLIVRLTPNRKLSSFDYVLELDGKDYPCLAVAENDDSYNAENWNVTNPVSGSLYRMIFQIPGFDGDRKNMKLKMILRESKLPPAEIKFVRKGSFTQVSDLLRESDKTESVRP